MSAVAKAMGTNEAAASLYDFIARLGARQSLRELGMPEAGIEKAALLAIQNPYWNPRKLEYQPVYELIRRAWAGEAPDTMPEAAPVTT